MRYMGGKARVARRLAALVLENTTERRFYLEPFCGALSVYAQLAPHFDQAQASDTHPDLVLFWNELQAGWRPPEWVTREEWRALKNTTEPSALRGHVGFNQSFGARWFAAYADNKNGKNYSDTGTRGSLKKLALLDEARHLPVLQADYRQWEVDPGDVVYCDPPYAGVAGYGGTEKFDSDEFWKVADCWVNDGAHVFVSEYNAPEGWDLLWEKQTSVGMNSDKSKKLFQTERFWTKKRES